MAALQDVLWSMPRVACRTPNPPMPAKKKKEQHTVAQTSPPVVTITCSPNPPHPTLLSPAHIPLCSSPMFWVSKPPVTPILYISSRHADDLPEASFGKHQLPMPMEHIYFCFVLIACPALITAIDCSRLIEQDYGLMNFLKAVLCCAIIIASEFPLGRRKTNYASDHD